MKLPHQLQELQELLQPTPLLAVGATALTLLVLGSMASQGPKSMAQEARTPRPDVVAQKLAFVEEAEARREQILQKAEERLDEAKTQGKAPWVNEDGGVTLPPLPDLSQSGQEEKLPPLPKSKEQPAKRNN